MDWNRLYTFLVVAEAGSFTKAGGRLGITQSAVSRQIKALEDELKTALFLRHLHGLILTEVGEEFVGTVRNMSTKLELGLARLNERRAKPEGPLRLTTSVAFGSAWLTSRVNRFHLLYPDISVSLLLADIELDLSLRQADCAIRFSAPSQLNLIQKYLTSFSYRIFASASYLREHGTPQSLVDLNRHALVVYGDEFGAPVKDINWLVTAGMSQGEVREPALRVNSIYGIYRAVESGLGIAALPFYMSERSKELVHILPEVEGPTIPVYFVYPEELRHSRRIDAVRDFLLEEVAKDHHYRPLRRATPA